MLDDDIDDDTHLCIKCSASIIGLDNYVKHRKNLCSGQISDKNRCVTENPLNKLPATVTTATQSTITTNNIVQPYRTFSFGSSFTKCDDNDVKTSKSLSDSYDLAYELGADVFFSSLELQSVQATSGKTTNHHNTIVPRKNSSVVWIEDTPSASSRNSENLMKAVRDISGIKKVDEIFKPIKYEHESPELSDENEDDEDNHYNDEDYESKIVEGVVVDKARSTSPAIPSSHTGGKWRPENRPKQLRLRLSPRLSWTVSPTRHSSWDANQIETNYPPDDYTKGKWVPGTKIEKHQYKQAVALSNSPSKEFWCKICCRKLKSKLFFENHLKTNYHLKRCEPESQLEKASLEKIQNHEFESNFNKEASTLLQNDRSDASCRIKRNRRTTFINCDVCNHKISRHIIGKHLISHYHYVRISLNPLKSFNMILNNIHSIVLQSPFQCRPCRFYSNTESTFLLHWNSVNHQSITEGPGKFLCSYCRFDCESNKQMEQHLLGVDHNEVINIINRSVPICISKISTIECLECGKQFKYNVELRRHYLQSHSLIECAGTASDSYQCRFYCSICSQVLKSEIALRRHQKFKHKKSVFFCSICDMHFDTFIQAKKHRKTSGHRRKTKMNRNENASQDNLNQDQHESNAFANLNSLKCSMYNFSSTSEVESILHEIKHATNNEKNDEMKTLSPSEKNSSLECLNLKSGKKAVGIQNQNQSEICTFCKQEFKDCETLQQHLRKIHSDFRYKCVLCGECFPILQMLGNHVKYKSCISSLSKNKVGNFHSTLDIGNIHAISTENGKIWKCPECEYRAPYKADIVFHQMCHTLGKLSASKKYACPVCSKNFRKTSLRWHLRSHTKEQTFECQTCSKKFLRRHTLKNHIEVIHSSRENKSSTKSQSFQCNQCEKSFHKKHSLEMHLINHDGKTTKYSCNVEGCKYNARDQHTLKIHFKSHSKEKSFQCKEEGCKYKGKSGLHLKRHSKMHESPKRVIKCTKCDFKAKIPGHIKRHMRIHTLEKPYKCPHCDYKSGFQENLRKHILSTSKHRGKFIYECLACDQENPDAIFKSNYYEEFISHQSSKHSS